ncbi:MAG: isoprenylcysteine carboxyl methyltransferase family protein [Alphaproteobacteria bacterium]
MSALHAVVAFILLARLVELGLAARNTRRLLGRGGYEVGARHYPLFFILHGGWLVALLATVDSATPAELPFLGGFLLLQPVRVWIIASLGERWTTRVIVVPGAPLVRKGPYRYLRHPNYLVVACEIALVPLTFGAWEIAALFSVLNLALLRHRIRVEEAALAAARPG